MLESEIELVAGNWEIAQETVHLARGDTSFFRLYIAPELKGKPYFGPSIPAEKIFGPSDKHLHRRHLPKIALECYYRGERALFCKRALEFYCGIDSQIHYEKISECWQTGLPTIRAYHQLSKGAREKLCATTFFQKCRTTLGNDYEPIPTLHGFTVIQDYLPAPNPNK